MLFSIIQEFLADDKYMDMEDIEEKLTSFKSKYQTTIRVRIEAALQAPPPS